MHNAHVSYVCKRHLKRAAGGFVNLPARLRKLPDYRWVAVRLADRQSQRRDGRQENLCQGVHVMNVAPAATGQSLALAPAMPQVAGIINVDTIRSDDSHGK